MKTLIAVIATLALAGCDWDWHKPQHEAVVGNGFSVALLGEYDGCKVYEFSASRAVYFVRCAGTDHVTTMSEFQTHHGKMTSTEYQDVTTYEGR